jgi:hypothetical protein
VGEPVAVGEVVQRAAQPPLDGARQHAAVLEERLAARLQRLHQPVAHDGAAVPEGDVDERGRAAPLQLGGRAVAEEAQGLPRAPAERAVEIQCGGIGEEQPVVAGEPGGVPVERALGRVARLRVGERVRHEVGVAHDVRDPQRHERAQPRDRVGGGRGQPRQERVRGQRRLPLGEPFAHRTG